MNFLFAVLYTSTKYFLCLYVHKSNTLVSSTFMCILIIFSFDFKSLLSMSKAFSLYAIIPVPILLFTNLYLDGCATDKLMFGLSSNDIIVSNSTILVCPICISSSEPNYIISSSNKSCNIVLSGSIKLLVYAFTKSCVVVFSIVFSFKNYAILYLYVI